VSEVGGEARREPGAAQRRRHEVGVVPTGPVRASAHVCEAASCLSSQSDRVLEAISDGVRRAGLTDVAVKRVGCLGLCAAGPLVQVPQSGRLFEHVQPGDADGGTSVDGVVEALRSLEPGQAPAPPLPFFSRQVRVVTECSGRIDPESLDDYLAAGGYEALRAALTTMTPAQVAEEVTRSGLRGRGGAGYPTGLKWSTVAKAPGDAKYVICNADEGDPGAFMDRSVLESDPHRVLEGMAIAGYAVGAAQGYIYCRAEYPLAVARLRTAIRLATRAGLLGGEIADTPFGFTIEIRLGAGAFVCGEETALIASVQGSRGSPRPRPPYPAVSGLWGRPTLINNVETYAAVAPILRNGGDWYAGIGTPTSKGTKVFALAGRVRNTGLVEVPMGVTLREIVYEIGGGIVDGRPFKAVQTGGPSGGCLPEELLDMPVDYQSLQEAGSIMGSGGMIVMDDTACMVDVARYFMDFCREESCGKCVPCRVGTHQLHLLLTRITEGEASLEDLRRLERLAGMVQSTSLCGLGQNAPNPVFSTLRYFRHEYLEHVDRTCRAGVCPVADREVVG
jgi:bidirectional [NiFe] hydrogenase diaphorase subunit